MSQYRNTPRWAQNTTIEAEVERLTRLEAGAALVRLIISSVTEQIRQFGTGLEPKPANEARDEAALQQQAESDAASLNQLADTMESAEGRPAPEKPKREAMPRIHIPSMLALGLRASELMAQLAPLIHDQTMALVRAGIDPRPALRRAATARVAEIFLEELGIDLEHIDQATHTQLLDALKIVRGWIRDFKRGLPLTSPKEQADARPRPREVADRPENAKTLREAGSNEMLKKVLAEALSEPKEDGTPLELPEPIAAHVEAVLHPQRPESPLITAARLFKSATDTMRKWEGHWIPLKAPRSKTGTKGKPGQ